MSGQKGAMKINLFTIEAEPLGDYHAMTVPREGDMFIWDDDLYHVESVIWEGAPGPVEAQLRLAR